VLAQGGRYGIIVSMPLDEIPQIGMPLAVRGRRDLAVVLDEFAPTHLDAWRGRAVVVPAGVRGVPDDAPDQLVDDAEGALVVTAVVVRHAGGLSGRRPMFSSTRRRRLDALLTAAPPARPLLGVIVERDGVSAVWLGRDPDAAARQLSAPDWRATVG